MDNSTSMTHASNARRFRRLLGRVAGAVLAVGLAGCSTDKILDVTDPDIINPVDVNSPAGAAALRAGALGRLVQITGGSVAQSESFFLMGGMLADEFRSGDTFTERNETDQRGIRTQNSVLESTIRLIYRARTAAAQARATSDKYDPTAEPWELAEMHDVQAYAEILLAEHVCNGIPLSSVIDAVVTPGAPLSDSAVFAHAIVQLDSALGRIAGKTDAASLEVKDWTNLEKARAQLDLGQFAAAGATAALVRPGFVRQVEFSDNSWYNQIWSLNNSVGRYTVANNEGPLAMNYVTANDPRIPVCTGGTAPCNAVGATSGVVFDAASGLVRYAQEIYPDRYAPVTIADYVEAQLIVAEAQLKVNDPAYLTTLNNLRANYVSPALPALTDPATLAERQDLLFRERGFWLFARGNRLGDMRRLIRQYGRTANSVFPTGAFIKGGSYGTDVNFPMVQAEQNNPLFNGCIDRNA